MFRILQVSDPHFGPKCHWPDKDPEAVARDSVAEIKSALLEHARDDLPPSFDAVLLSGDFCWGSPILDRPDAREVGFRTAVHFVRQLLEAKLVLSRDSLIFVPGNHDILWSEKDSKGNPRFSLRATAEKRYQDFVRECLPEQQVLQDDHLQLQSHLGHVHHFAAGDREYLVVALNSCRIESQDQAGMGYVGYDQLYGLIKQALSLDARQLCRVIVVLHHHVLPVETVRLRRMAAPPVARRVSFVTDAYDLLTTCLAMGADVVLHGHMHTPHQYSYELAHVEGSAAQSQKLVISAAGSFCLGQASRNIERSHQFQVVELSDALVRVYSFEADLKPEGAERLPWTLRKLVFPFDGTGGLNRIASALDETKLGNCLFEQRLFDDVNELDAWSRSDPLARELIRSRVRSSKLTSHAREHFDAAFNHAEANLATTAFFAEFQRRLRLDAPKALHRVVEEMMNEWTAS
ncbi:MAG: metallophosphoesterase [Bryobacteraceae bacterium]|nr:metallophosphoesterase [Bryobacteraceae bacterium]